MFITRHVIKSRDYIYKKMIICVKLNFLTFKVNLTLAHFNIFALGKKSHLFVVTQEDYD